jgi:uncharacterized protein (DUF486 family)
MTTLALLICSNIFMTIAWYGHLKFTDARLWIVILAAWGIALVEYCFAVPANRIGYMQGFSGGQLKVMQEVVTLLVFGVFAVLVLKEPLGWRHAGAFICLTGAAMFMFAGKTA